MRKGAAAILLLVSGVLAALYAWSSLEPLPWVPPATAPTTEAYALNDRLQPLEWWAKTLKGPEAITIDATGALYAGLSDGRVVRLRVGSDVPEVMVDTQGRPLAVAFHPDGRLIICDAKRGLLALSPSGTLEVLATSFGGIPFGLVDDLAITRDGIIYFSDASTRHSLGQFTEDLLEHQTTGRVLKYTPETKAVSLVADGFSFANGLALSGDESFLVISETGTYRLWRWGLTGKQAGKKELFTDSLPGFPDNVRYSPTRNGFWVAIGSPRKPEVDMLASWPRIRRIIGALPHALQPQPARHSYLLLVDLEGRPVESFQHLDPESYSPIACATEHDGWLYLGSFVREGLARFKLP
jgi:sugar lactone lactonase YvrE